MKTKILFIITSLLISANVFGVAAFAEESSTISATVSSSSSSSSNTESSYADTDSADTEIEKRESNCEVDKLTGNADLIKEKKIIHDSSEMQFIAVTTKDDQVFYILIDYTATSDTNSGEGVVYFLNKVDSSDLLAIANRSDNNVDKTTDNDILNLTTAESTDDDITDAATNDNSAIDNNNKNEPSDSYSIYIIFGVIGVGVVVGYYFLKIKPKKNAISDDDDFEMDDYEINEDDEKNT